jgi:2-aminoadipate transaminase
MLMQHNPLSKRLQNLQPSFIRQILKVTQNPEVISFAGGLPNPDFFPVEALKNAADQVFTNQGKEALQYTLTAGYPPLREWIVSRYYSKVAGVTADDIIITTGSQQAIDIIGKLLIDPGDHVVVEDPSYLGALQSLSVYEAAFIPIELTMSGLNLDSLQQELSHHHPKCMYAVPTFQNPTGMSYTAQTREKLAVILEQNHLILIEDDPYQEIRFTNELQSSIKSMIPDLVFHVGSFSKMVAPGLRLGWMCTPSIYRNEVSILKEGADLHSNHLAQRILYEYLTHNDLKSHLEQINNAYKEHRDLMLNEIKHHFPSTCEVTYPEGGMFLWVTLPNHLSSSDLFDTAITQNVAFVPGKYFFSNQQNDSCLRLNFSNSDPENITKGITLLGQLIHHLS